MSKFCVVVWLLVPLLAATAAEKKPDPAESARLNNLGVALMNQQRMDKALEKFQAAVKEDPSSATAELNLGIALLNLQKLPEAQEALHKAAKEKPQDAHVWCNLGLLDRTLTQYDEAIQDFKKVVELDPTDADSYYLLGSLYTQLQKYPEAIAAFEAALKNNPVHASAEFGLARALQRSGKVDEARQHLHIFEHLTHDKISTPMTLVYGEQGKYSIAEDMRTTQPEVAPMIPVKFVPRQVESTSSYTYRDGGVVQALSGAMCMIDVNGDGNYDLVLLGSGAAGVQVFVNDGAGKFKEAPPKQFGIAINGGVACAVGDFDNDGKPDLALAGRTEIALFHNEGSGKFTDVAKTAGIVPMNDPRGITFVDYDHDGDLDLYVTGEKSQAGKNFDVLWRNNGNATFTEWAEHVGLEGKFENETAVLSDINNDRAVDLVLTGNGPATVYANPREGNFKPSPLYDEKLPTTLGAYVFDFNKDGWMDVVLTHAGAPGLSLWKNGDGKRFERVPLAADDVKKAWGVTAIDFDNDGWLDFAAVVETAKGTELRVFRNEGSAGFKDVSKSLGLDAVKVQDARALVAADVDGDGAADLIVSRWNGAPVVLHNNGGNKNHSLRIQLKGLADNRSGFGTKVEVFADGMWQKFELAAASGYLAQGPNEILAGLGSQRTADVVRMLWPTGILQDETEIAAEKPVQFTEIDRRGSSCPTLFAWNGKKYEFISDVIGAGVVGHWVSPTEKNLADPDEWVKVDGSQLKSKNGKLSLRFGEPMEEVNFIDQVRLVAVDHPANVDVYPDERFLSEKPFASGKVVVTGHPHELPGAWDDHGRDVRPLLREHDHRFVKDFTNLSYPGYANMHTLTIDLGEWTPTAPLRLFLQGFIEYFTANSMYAAWQAGIDPVAPYVEAQMPDGSWKKVIDDMGFPAGLPRMITVDLTGKIPGGARKIRLVTNLQIYWDQILVDNSAPSGDARTTALPLLSSNLEFRGYPQQLDGKTLGDLTYVYENVSKTGPFAHERGEYTRYGEVTDLLKSVDDHYVIFGSGEDMDLEFDPSRLPTLPAGWERDYFFYANGFVKDMDFYEASAFTVAQMPFHGMSAYPYPAKEHYPDDPDTVRYRLEWNDRFDSGAEDGKHYGFRYEKRQ